MRVTCSYCGFSEDLPEREVFDEDGEVENWCFGEMDEDCPFLEEGEIQ